MNEIYLMNSDAYKKFLDVFPSQPKSLELPSDPFMGIRIIHSPYLMSTPKWTEQAPSILYEFDKWFNYIQRKINWRKSVARTERRLLMGTVKGNTA